MFSADEDQIDLENEENALRQRKKNKKYPNDRMSFDSTKETFLPPPLLPVHVINAITRGSPPNSQEFIGSAASSTPGKCGLNKRLFSFVSATRPTSATDGDINSTRPPSKPVVRLDPLDAKETPDSTNLMNPNNLNQHHKLSDSIPEMDETPSVVNPNEIDANGTFKHAHTYTFYAERPSVNPSKNQTTIIQMNNRNSFDN